jgi:hypothetical protein
MEDTIGGQKGLLEPGDVGGRVRGAATLEEKPPSQASPHAGQRARGDALPVVSRLRYTLSREMLRLARFLRSPTCPPSEGRPTELGASQGALLQLATAFPRPVWLDHLLPLLELEDIVILRATCKAMRAIVADMRAHLYLRPLRDLRAMLTCFPKAADACLCDDKSLTLAEQDNLIAWLKERGHSLTRVQNPNHSVEPFHRRAWRAGAFGSIKNVNLHLKDPEDRELILDGFVSGVESIYVASSPEASEVERAALAPLRTFPALKEIACYMMGSEDTTLPPFVPPSLEKLTFRAVGTRPLLQLGCLHGMIKSSGAKLQSLKLLLEEVDDGDVARGVRSLLQACASTLKEFELPAQSSFQPPVEVLEGLASCPHLERLTARTITFAVMPPGGVTFRLSHLDLTYHNGDEGSLSSLALWGLMAQGGFPTLSSFSLDTFRCRWGAELGPAVVAAFEGVAATLKTLKLGPRLIAAAMGEHEAYGVALQVGEAIGKLRRLETLDLDIGGRSYWYHRVAEGMAKGACPALRSLSLKIEREAVWLAYRPTIILPSVRALRVTFGRRPETEPMGVACVLTALEYRGFVMIVNQGDKDQIRVILQPRVNVGFP